MKKYNSDRVQSCKQQEHPATLLLPILSLLQLYMDPEIAHTSL